MHSSEDKTPHATPFEWFGGEEKVRAVVDRFYDLMDLEPKYAELRAAHGTDRFGHPRLRARHLPFKIGILERDQWLACMDQAMGEVGIDEALRQRLRDSFFQTADWMRNTHG